MLFALSILFCIVAVMVLGARLSAPKYRGPVTDHFDGKRFFNPDGYHAKGTADVIRWMMTRQRGSWQENTSAVIGKRPLDHYRGGVRITFVNHSTFLIQVDGVNILIDPIWSKRASPFTWMGPRRMRPPGIKLEDLPRIHLVLLTHNHYDHLDLQTMRIVFGAHHPKIVTPLGVKAFLEQEKIGGVSELDWWEQFAGDGINIQAVPAQHFSGRGMNDRDATLWCGYVIASSSGKIYCAGDTGYHPKTFSEIGQKSGPFKVSIIPIGAYKPSWFMSPIHISPREAVRIHFDVQSEKSIACHFGTFPLADDSYDDPIKDLAQAKAEHNLTEDDFIIMQEGEARVFE